MADIDHIKDVDNNVTYKLVDSEARSDISDLRIALVSTGDKYLGVYDARWHPVRTDPDDPLTEIMVIDLNNAYNNVNGRPAFFPNDYAATCVRVLFFETLPSPVDSYLNLLLYFEDGYQQGVRYYPVYSDTTESRQLRVSDVYGKAIDFVYIQIHRAFFIIGVPVSIEADEVNYDNTTSLLSSTNVQDAIDEVVGELNNKADSSSLATVATSGDYDDLTNKPTIPAAQVNSDWNAASGVAQILNKPSLSAVATSGDYDDLTNKPSLAAVATSGDYGDLDNTPSLATVATSGDYDDLTNKPTIPADTYRPINIGSTPWLLDNDRKTLSFSSNGTVSIRSESSGKITISGTHADWSETVPTNSGYIQNKPTLATVANTGDYDDLSNKPDLSTKQDTLVSGSNIKTVNGESLLGSSDVVTPRPDNKTVYDTGSVSAASNTWVNCKSWTFPATGIWLVQASLTWDGNSSGYREAGINTSVAQPTAMNIMRMAPCSGQQTTANLTVMLTVTSTTQNYYLVERHNSSTSPLTVYPRISLLRLAP